MKTVFAIEGMHCAACVKKVQAALGEAGMSAEVTLLPPQATIESAMPLSLKKVQEAVASVGAYSAKVGALSERDTSATVLIPNAVSSPERITAAS